MRHVASDCETTKGIIDIALAIKTIRLIHYSDTWILNKHNITCINTKGHRQDDQYPNERVNNHQSHMERQLLRKTHTGKIDSNSRNSYNNYNDHNNDNNNDNIRTANDKKFCYIDGEIKYNYSYSSSDSYDHSCSSNKDAISILDGAFDDN